MVNANVMEWQTCYLEEVVPKGIRVRVPSFVLSGKLSARSINCHDREMSHPSLRPSCGHRCIIEIASHNDQSQHFLR